MQTIKISNLDDELIEKIKLRAKNNGYHLEEEIRELLIKQYRIKDITPQESRAEILDRIEKSLSDYPKASKAEIDSWLNKNRSQYKEYKKPTLKK